MKFPRIGCSWLSEYRHALLEYYRPSCERARRSCSFHFGLLFHSLPPMSHWWMNNRNWPSSPCKTARSFLFRMIFLCVIVIYGRWGVGEVYPWRVRLILEKSTLSVMTPSSALVATLLIGVMASPCINKFIMFLSANFYSHAQKKKKKDKR